MSVRPTRADDLPAVAALVEVMGGHEGVTTRPGWSCVAGASIADPDIRSFVAEQDGTVVGWAEVQARPNPTTGRREGWLCGLVVASDQRRDGIGRQLVDHAEHAARSLGCDSIWLETGQWRDASTPFYKSLGYREHTPALRLHKELDGSGGDLEDRFLVAAAAATAAVRGAVHLADTGDVAIGADGAPTTGLDRAAEAAALEALAPLGLVVVSEESGMLDPGVGRPYERQPTDGVPLVASGQSWICLDPLDGTRNARARGGPTACAVGLVRDGVVLAGLVAELVSGTRWSARRGGPALRDGRVVGPSSATGLVAVPSVRSDEQLTELPSWTARVRMSGSTAVDLCRVADGSLAAFVATRRLVVHHHDLAGPLAILEAAGAVVVNPAAPCLVPSIGPDPRAVQPIVASAPDVAADLLAGCVAEHGRSAGPGPLASAGPRPAGHGYRPRGT